MKKRPPLQIGDLVKLSKKGSKDLGLKYNEGIHKDSTLRVVDILSNESTSEQNAVISCRRKDGKLIITTRGNLWKIGEAAKAVQTVSTENIPQNNDGRSLCYKCEKHTKLVAGKYNLCDNSACSWYKN